MHTLSFWEKEQYFADVDYCIIGGGLTGMHTALSLVDLDPAANILIVERSFIPYGASTRNAGFACFGSLSELLDDLQNEPEAVVMERVQDRWNGLQHLIKRCGRANLQYEQCGGYELFTADDEKSYDACLQQLEWMNDRLEKITGTKNCYKVADATIRRFGFGRTIHMVKNRLEGFVNTGKMMQVLEQMVRLTGVKLVTGLNVTAIEAGNKPVVHTDKGFSFPTGKILVTTNGFAQTLLPSSPVVPARAQVLITDPVDGLKLHGTFHMDKGYYYFRNVGNRVMIGGGRNLDFEGEKTNIFGTTDLIQQKLESVLQEIVIPGKSFQVAQRWSGIMGFGKTRTTQVTQADQQVYVAAGLGGMGVAISPVIGKKAAAILKG